MNAAAKFCGNKSSAWSATFVTAWSARKRQSNLRRSRHADHQHRQTFDSDKGAVAAILSVRTSDYPLQLSVG
jgi:hypothetical protein